MTPDDTKVKDRDAVRARGGCLCGAVRYELHGALRDVVVCHCGQCRRTHGHYAAYTALPTHRLKLVNDQGLRWYQSSPRARRGFCEVCGSQLFFEPGAEDYVAVAAGTLDSPTGLKTIGHIFVDFAGDYYEISDNLPKLAGSMTGSELG